MPVTEEDMKCKACGSVNTIIDTMEEKDHGVTVIHIKCDDCGQGGQGPFVVVEEGK